MENNFVLSPISLIELELLVQNSMRKVLSERPILPPPPQLEIIFLKDVCNLTNLKPQTIYGLIYKHTIPFHKSLGTKKVWFKRSEILKWFEAGRPASNNTVQIMEDLSKKGRVK